MKTTTQPKYNHAFDFNIEIMSDCENASDITGYSLKIAFLDAINAIDDEQFKSAANCFDTIEHE